MRMNTVPKKPAVEAGVMGCFGSLIVFGMLVMLATGLAATFHPARAAFSASAPSPARLRR